VVEVLRRLQPPQVVQVAVALRLVVPALAQARQAQPIKVSLVLMVAARLRLWLEVAVVLLKSVVQTAQVRAATV
jgi:hypothetical protein